MLMSHVVSYQMMLFLCPAVVIFALLMSGCRDSDRDVEDAVVAIVMSGIQLSWS